MRTGRHRVRCARSAAEPVCWRPARGRCVRRRPHPRCPPSASRRHCAARRSTRSSRAGSQLSILVYRGGTLSRLGHNHVMTSQALPDASGFIRELAQLGLRAVVPGRASSSSTIREARRAAGSEFPPDIPQADKDGTRKNMLQAGGAGCASTIRTSSCIRRKSAARCEAPQVTARITIKDASRDVEVPVKVAIEGATADGERRVRHPADGVRHQAVQRRRSARWKCRTACTSSSRSSAEQTAAVGRGLRRRVTSRYSPSGSPSRVASRRTPRAAR